MTNAPNWWDRKIGDGTSIETFKGWVEDHAAESKVFVRKLVAEAGYKSILDCGAGLCSEYDGYKSDRYTIDYRALDATDRFVKMAQERGIPITKGSVEAIPFEAQAFDVVYCRHVLEHLPTYRTALAEMIRVARREAIVVWFIAPHDRAEGDRISVMDGDLYHNEYSRRFMMNYLKTLPGVAAIEWKQVSEKETVLSITKEGSCASA